MGQADSALAFAAELATDIGHHLGGHRRRAASQALAQHAIFACPVASRPHPEQITFARRGYKDWWKALDWVRDRLVATRMLREVKVTAVFSTGAVMGLRMIGGD